MDRCLRLGLLAQEPPPQRARPPLVPDSRSPGVGLTALRQCRATCATVVDVRPHCNRQVDGLAHQRIRTVPVGALRSETRRTGQPALRTRRRSPLPLGSSSASRRGEGASAQLAHRVGLPLNCLRDGWVDQAGGDGLPGGRRGRVGSRRWPPPRSLRALRTRAPSAGRHRPGPARARSRARGSVSAARPYGPPTHSPPGRRGSAPSAASLPRLPTPGGEPAASYPGRWHPTAPAAKRWRPGAPRPTRSPTCRSPHPRRARPPTPCAASVVALAQACGRAEWRVGCLPVAPHPLPHTGRGPCQGRPTCRGPRGPRSHRRHRPGRCCLSSRWAIANACAPRCVR